MGSETCDKNPHTMKLSLLKSTLSATFLVTHLFFIHLAVCTRLLSYCSSLFTQKVQDWRKKGFNNESHFLFPIEWFVHFYAAASNHCLILLFLWYPLTFNYWFGNGSRVKGVLRCDAVVTGVKLKGCTFCASCYKYHHQHKPYQFL